MDRKAVEGVVRNAERLDDESLRLVVRILRRMSVTRSVQSAGAFTVGQPVRLAQDCRPVGLAGVHAHVVGHSGKRVVVDLDWPVGRYYRGVRCPAELIEPRIEPEKPAKEYLPEIDDEVSRAERAVEDGQARWASTGSTRRSR